MSGVANQPDVKKDSAALEKSLTTLAWLVNINAKDLSKKHEKEDKGIFINQSLKRVNQMFKNICFLLHTCSERKSHCISCQ